MVTKVVYFELVSPIARAIIEECKAPHTEVAYWRNLSENEKKDCLSEAEHFITASHPISRQLMNDSPKLKFIQKTGSGVDNIDLAAAEERGVMVASTPGANATSVAELTIGLIIGLYRKLSFIDRETKAGKWLMWEHRASMFEMKGKTHGIIGIGLIGREVAKLSRAFGTEIIYYDVNRLPTNDETTLDISYRSLNELLSTSDIISLHIPLLPATRHLISTNEFALMKPSAIIINVARGNIIDEEALAQALRSNSLHGAAMDTWATEPIQADNPLLGFDTVIATPHIAGGTREAFEKVLTLSFQNIEKVERHILPDTLMTKNRSFRDQ